MLAHLQSVEHTQNLQRDLGETEVTLQVVFRIRIKTVFRIRIQMDPDPGFKRPDPDPFISNLKGSK